MSWPSPSGAAFSFPVFGKGRTGSGLKLRGEAEEEQGKGPIQLRRFQLAAVLVPGEIIRAVHGIPYSHVPFEVGVSPAGVAGEADVQAAVRAEPARVACAD